ncbi:FAD-dependent oxidoreductase [Sphingobacterium sp. SG20118]|uniref:FAD-dependent oxidoreductase n=1 Tax=Sphingobacterium sp. SG20118 TaxID=3367156 RepID=UPI0037DFC147
MMNRFLIIVATWGVILQMAYGQENKQVDLCIYGATSAGVAAAYTAAHAGKSVLLIDPGTRVGGLSFWWFGANGYR